MRVYIGTRDPLEPMCEVCFVPFGVYKNVWDLVVVIYRLGPDKGRVIQLSSCYSKQIGKAIVWESTRL